MAGSNSQALRVPDIVSGVCGPAIHLSAHPFFLFYSTRLELLLLPSVTLF